MIDHLVSARKGSNIHDLCIIRVAAAVFSLKHLSGCLPPCASFIRFYFILFIFYSRSLLFQQFLICFVSVKRERRAWKNVKQWTLYYLFFLLYYSEHGRRITMNVWLVQSELEILLDLLIIYSEPGGFSCGSSLTPSPMHVVSRFFIYIFYPIGGFFFFFLAACVFNWKWLLVASSSISLTLSPLLWWQSAMNVSSCLFLSLSLSKAFSCWWWSFA